MKAYIHNMDMFHEDYDFEKDTLLFEIEEVDIHDIIKHNDKFYVVCMKSNIRNFIAVKETKYNPEGEEQRYEPQLICPFCGYVDLDSWEMSDDSGETECGSCGSTFDFVKEVEITYSTFPGKANEVKEI